MAQTKKPMRFGPGELPIEFVPQTWDDLEVGEEFGPIEFSIRASSHEKHSAHIGMGHPWFLEKSPWGGPVLYPFEIWCQARVMSRYFGRLNLGTLAGQKWEFFKPGTVGQKLIGRAKITAKYKKRGKDWYEVESTTYNESGQLLFRCTDALVTLVNFTGKLHE